MKDWPSDLHIAKCVLIDNNPIVGADSQGLNYRSNKLPAQRFEFKITSTTLEDAEIKSVCAEMGAIKRDNDYIEKAMPIWSDSNTSTLTLTSDASAGEHALQVNSTAGVVVGDFFNPESSGKCYQVTEIIDANNIEIFPKLVDDVFNLGVLIFDGCKFRIKPEDKNLQWELDGNNANGKSSTIVFIEVWK